MDMFDFSSVIEFIKIEPGHGILQSVLLFMIWIQGKGLRKEIGMIKDALAETKSVIDKRFEKIEWRITAIENRGKKNGTDSFNS